jgi:predicted RNase H-like HicB family nuclease
MEIHDDLTTTIERDGEWFIAFCPKVPGANGQGRSEAEARASLREAIELIREDQAEDHLVE